MPGERSGYSAPGRVGPGRPQGGDVEPNLGPANWALPRLQTEPRHRFVPGAGRPNRARGQSRARARRGGRSCYSSARGSCLLLLPSCRQFSPLQLEHSPDGRVRPPPPPPLSRLFPRPGPSPSGLTPGEGRPRRSSARAGLAPGHRRLPDGAGRLRPGRGRWGRGASRRTGPRGKRRPWRMALPPGGDPCPGPTPGLSQPHRPGFVPAGRPVPPPALPRPPSSAGSASTLEAGPGGSDSGAGTRNGTRRGLSASPSPCQHGKDAEISSRRRPRAAPAPAGLSGTRSPLPSPLASPVPLPGEFLFLSAVLFLSGGSFAPAFDLVQRCLRAPTNHGWKHSGRGSTAVRQRSPPGPPHCLSMRGPFGSHLQGEAELRRQSPPAG